MSYHKQNDVGMKSFHYFHLDIEYKEIKQNDVGKSGISHYVAICIEDLPRPFIDRGCRAPWVRREVHTAYPLKKTIFEFSILLFSILPVQGSPEMSPQRAHEISEA